MVEMAITKVVLLSGNNNHRGHNWRTVMICDWQDKSFQDIMQTILQSLSIKHWPSAVAVSRPPVIKTGWSLSCLQSFLLPRRVSRFLRLPTCLYCNSLWRMIFLRVHIKNYSLGKTYVQVKLTSLGSFDRLTPWRIIPKKISLKSTGYSIKP